MENSFSKSRLFIILYKIKSHEKRDKNYEKGLNNHGFIFLTKSRISGKLGLKHAHPLLSVPPVQNLLKLYWEIFSIETIRNLKPLSNAENYPVAGQRGHEKTKEKDDNERR